jgi:hypothetical protein
LNATSRTAPPKSVKRASMKSFDSPTKRASIGSFASAA